MRRSKWIRVAIAFVGGPYLFTAGCNQAVVDAIAVGVRDTSVAAASAAIDDVFQNRLGININGGDNGEDSGNDLFIRM